MKKGGGMGCVMEYILYTHTVIIYHVNKFSSEKGRMWRKGRPQKSGEILFVFMILVCLFTVTDDKRGDNPGGGWLSYEWQSMMHHRAPVWPDGRP